jgi:hypothetical protein
MSKCGVGISTVLVELFWTNSDYHDGRVVYIIIN